MSRKVTPELLANCLADIEAGRMTVEQCLTLHSSCAEELRPLLEAAHAIPSLPAVKPDPAFRMRGRAALMAAIAADKNAVTNSPLRRLWKVISTGWEQPVQPSNRRTGMPALIIALVIALTAAGGGASVYASGEALPGGPLYQVKTTIEGFRVALAAGDEAKAAAYLGLAEKRAAEVQKASQAGHTLAASMAAEAFAQNVAQADTHLARAASTGDVDELIDRLEENLARQERTLTAVGERAPEQARAALARAAEAAGQGLTKANAARKSHAPAPKPGATPTVSLSADVAKETPIISGTLSVTFTQILSDVQNLAKDPGVPGESHNGLLAKLRSAQEALSRGQPEVAARIMDAFLNELNAMRGSRHISEENYDALLARYRVVVASLNESAKPPATPRPGRPDSAERSAPTRTPPGRR